MISICVKDPPENLLPAELSILALAPRTTSSIRGRGSLIVNRKNPDYSAADFVHLHRLTVKVFVLE